MATQPETTDNAYWAPVDRDLPNNSHAFALDLLGANKRVLELGSAAGHFTRALVADNCRVVAVELDPQAARSLEDVAERVVVGDLSDPEVIASAIDDEGFDVVVAGDVLEHIPDPLSVLQACRPALKPGGFVVVSVPNIAHADIKLQLLAGNFSYQDKGLLDRSHVHFFTRSSVEEMLRDAGFLMIDLRRVVLPVFTTEQAVDPATVSPDVLASVLADPESETYQFVVRAVVHDGDAELAELTGRALALQDELAEERARRVAVETERDEAVVAASLLEPLLQEANGRARDFEELAEARQRHIDALMSSRSYRIMAPLRAVRSILR